ncbi:uncharacterized protein A4U43_UnF3230 [Asparagus officinalis]|uniref:non-specific serine/threonine protein kinase n=1 Tax=Asparagus officinalis TaxID=4686 RepID=A0A1R3L754_ASPOF|nr:uncharacterized protein A4U43_UnF3230 [Asparagus officinalis]
MRAVVLVFLVLFGLSCLGEERGCEAQKLVQDEVTALQKIALKLQKEWNFSVDPCSGSEGWKDPWVSNYIANNVNCSCNATLCHVTSIELKSQNLSGELPSELANLTHLNFLDLSRNYLNGSIPASWASLPLTNLTLLGNRISGRIPEELGSMSTLLSFVLEDNQMEGPIPATLSKLTMLNRLFLTGNNFSGQLPESLGNLKNMKDMRIDGNPISGKIPDFIGNWSQLQRLDMQGTSLEGPFPPSFAKLSSITELRVSDLKGGDGKFPPLHNMNGMKELVLRNLSISGQIPYYIGDMPLKLLDLSFNKLSGTIPSNFVKLQNYITNMYITNNMLQGSIPNWIFTSKEYLDLSYNNFTGSPAPTTCQQGNVNFLSSYSSTNSNKILRCLQRNIPCSENPNFNLFINCGGGKVTIGDDEYEDDDTSPLGAAIYSQSESGKWAYSSTGSFVGKDKAQYIAINTSTLNTSNPELYIRARLSPLSLKYYGLCLQNGSYNVSLHFAEIIFTDDQTFYSVGRRVFDVSIQGEKVLEDFDIAKEADGTGKTIIKNFTANVNGTLEIHFYWAGKGTRSVPHKGVYGPLISAISVTPNFVPKLPDTGKHKLSVGKILSIAASACAAIFLSVVLLWLCWRRKNVEDNELKGLELQTSIFSLKQIKAATNNFDPLNKIGEGGFGPVYKGVLPNCLLIAVKQLSSKSRQGNREFINEIGMISAIQHPNLVKLYGCCTEGNQLLLIYEYMENNSLARALFGPERCRLELDWPARCKICLGIARGLAYLHEESRIKIVHRDIKATNILLDEDLNAKISDFGLAKLDEQENTHISTRIAGTIGYMAPEYAMRGYLTDKADVYSFGVVMLEIVSGVSNTNYRPQEDFTYLLDWAYVLEEEGRLLELVDQNLGLNYSKEEALRMLNLSLICTNQSLTLRPPMSMVVSMLDGEIPVQAPSKIPSNQKNEGFKFRSFENISHYSQSQTVSKDVPYSELSISVNSREDGVSCSSSMVSY